MKSNDFHSLGVIYYQMAEFAKKEGKNSDHLIKLGYQMKLRSQENSLFEYQKSGFIKEVVFINTGVNVLTWRESRNKTLFYYIANQFMQYSKHVKNYSYLVVQASEHN